MAASSNQFYDALPPTNFSVFRINDGGGGFSTNFGNSIPSSSMSSVAPGAVPQQGWRNPNPLSSGYNTPMNFAKGPGGIGFEDPMYPKLGGTFSQWLQSQIGQGANPFNLPVPLATGGSTQPGQLSAPLNPTLQQLLDYFQTGKSPNAGVSALNTLSQGTSAIPQWQADLAAMKQNIQENQANLKEQFGSTGALGGSEYGNAMKDYMAQTTADQNALLAQIQQQNQQTQLQAGGALTNLQSQIGQIFQGLNQQDIQNVLQEFIRTSPEYSPLLNLIYGQANSFAPIFNYSKGGGIMAGLIPGLASAAGAGAAAGIGGGSASDIALAALAAL